MNSGLDETLPPPGVNNDVASRSKDDVDLVAASPLVGVRKTPQNIAARRNVGVTLTATRNRDRNRDRFATGVLNVQNDLVRVTAVTACPAECAVMLVADAVLRLEHWAHKLLGRGGNRG